MDTGGLGDWPVGSFSNTHIYIQYNVDYLGYLDIVLFIHVSPITQIINIPLYYLLGQGSYMYVFYMCLEKQIPDYVFRKYLVRFTILNSYLGERYWLRDITTD